MSTVEKTEWMALPEEAKVRGMLIWLGKDVEGFSPARKHIRRTLGCGNLDDAIREGNGELAAVLVQCWDALLTAGYEPHRFLADPEPFCALVIAAAS